MNLMKPGTRLRQMSPRARSLSSVAWTPASLSGLAVTLLPALARQQGKLWQDAAKTVAATADGDPVRVAVCPFTAKEFTAPSDAARPLLWDEGGGKWSLSFDGVDDGVSAASITLSGDLTVCVALRASGTAGIVYEHSANANTSPGAYLFGSINRTIKVRRSTVESGRNLTLNWLVDSTYRTVTHRCDGTNAGNVLRLNEVSQSLTDVEAFSPGTSTATDTLFVGSRNNASLRSTMRFAGGVWASTVSAALLSQLESYLTATRP